jgi:hypothetical protein
LTDFHHAYWDGQSTSRALAQMTDWLREIHKKIVGAVLLDFSAAFGIIQNRLLLEKLVGFTNLNLLRACAIVHTFILSPHKRDHNTQFKISKQPTNYIHLGTGQKALNIYGNLVS